MDAFTDTQGRAKITSCMPSTSVHSPAVCPTEQIASVYSTLINIRLGANFEQIHCKNNTYFNKDGVQKYR